MNTDNKPAVTRPGQRIVLALRAFTMVALVGDREMVWQLAGTDTFGAANLDKTTNMHPCDIENNIKE